MNELAPPGSGTELERSTERETGGGMNEPPRLGTAFNPFNRNRAIVISLLALALAGLSFHSGLDNLASAKIDELTKQNLWLLGVAITIDVVISVLQTAELSLGFVSGQVGQALDPINDGVERLTDALLLATGSLLLQDILLKITSGAVFKWGFLAIAATTATCVLLAQSNRVRTAFAASFGVSHVALARFQGVLIKTFILATVVRFIVPAFATASLLVSQALVAPEIRQQTEALEQHEKSLSEVGAQISQARDEAIEEQESQAESLPHDETEGSAPGGEAEPTSSSSVQPALRPKEDLEALREQEAQLKGKLVSLESEKNGLSDRISEKENSGWKDWIPEFTDDPDEALAQAIARVEQTESEIARKQWEAACVGAPGPETIASPTSQNMRGRRSESARCNWSPRGMICGRHFSRFKRCGRTPRLGPETKLKAGQAGGTGSGGSWARRGVCFPEGPTRRYSQRSRRSTGRLPRPRRWRSNA